CEAVGGRRPDGPAQDPAAARPEGRGARRDRLARRRRGRDLVGPQDRRRARGDLGVVLDERPLEGRPARSRYPRTHPPDRNGGVTMAKELQGKRIAFVATDGVEQVELTKPWRAMEKAGADPVLVSDKEDRLRGFNHVDEGDTFDVDLKTSEARAEDFDALVLPGGVVNADAI